MTKALIGLIHIDVVFLVLLCGCASDSSSTPAAAGAGAGSGAGGSGSAGRDPDRGNLPNLSTGGHGGSSSAAGSGGSGANCGFLALGECVGQAIDEAVACLAQDRSGTFNAERTRCELPEADAEIAFAAPARTGDRGYQLDFQLQVMGDECMRFAIHSEAAGGPFVEKYELSSEHHDVVYWLGFQRRLECDGQTFDYQATDLTACAVTPKFDLPMPIVTPMVSSIVFEFPRAAGHRSRLFMCSDPE